MWTVVVDEATSPSAPRSGRGHESLYTNLAERVSWPRPLPLSDSNASHLTIFIATKLKSCRD
jgi:hypothetical protein